MTPSKKKRDEKKIKNKNKNEKLLRELSGEHDFLQSLFQIELTVQLFLRSIEKDQNNLFKMKSKFFEKKKFVQKKKTKKNK